MMAMTAYVSEYRSMTFKCKASVSSSVEFSELNSFPESNHRMAPQQLSHQEIPQKSSERVPDLEQSKENQESPISSPGTSSSSPVLAEEGADRGSNQGFALRDSQMEDASSDDDSESMQNEMSRYHVDQDEYPSPLEQLKCALGKNGMLGQKLDLPNYTPPKDDNLGRNSSSIVHGEEPCIYYDSNEPYKCHLCSYAGSSKLDFNGHMNTHFDHKCQYCDYTSRTEGRLKRHIKDFHSETPPESWAGTRVPRADGSGGEQSMDDSVSSSGTGKPRTYRCKQCNFVAFKKSEFWSHHKMHIKAEKLLTCPQCEFVTEYKHHLEYHIRNHFGSKPFKCNKCNYSCVNKSMLNSHMKSHSNIYQYRCANCTYATKYCHSLKLHLRKYDHKPATVLNMDGTPNPYPVIDVYGTRRGPRSKKRKLIEDSDNNPVSSSAVVPSQQSINYSPVPQILPPNVPVMYHPQFFNGYHGNIFMRPPIQMDATSSSLSHHVPHFTSKRGSPQKCSLCDFVTDIQEVYQKHMLLHAASEHQDLAKLYGFNSDAILNLQDQQIALSSYSQNQRHYLESTPRNEGTFSFKDREPDVINDTPRRSESMFSKSVKSEGSENCHTENPSSSPPTVGECRQLCLSSERNSESPSQETEPEEEPDEKDNAIIAHTSNSPNCVSQQQLEISSSTKGDVQESKSMEHSPLDLSNAKSVGQRSSKISQATELHSEHLTTDLNQVPQNRNDTSGMVSQCQSRNRRKGKAFKIDRNIQYEDQSLMREYSNKSFDQNSYDDLHQNILSNPHGIRDNLTPSSITDRAFSPISHMKQHPVSENTHCPPSRKASLAFDESATINGHQMPPDQVLTTNTQNATNKAPNSQGSKDTNSNEYKSLSDMLVPKIEIDVEEETNTRGLKWPDLYICSYCDIAFGDGVMYTMHMGYHGYGDPFTCNMCGQVSKDKRDFSLHIARTAHT